MPRKPVELPSLKYDFSHSLIEAIEVGPRREVTFTITILVWHGTRGHSVPGIQVRFGGIENFDEVASFFDDPPYDRDLEKIDYSGTKTSKPGHLVFVMYCERVPKSLEIRCSSVQVTGPRS
jgi:hypothetical protein